MASPDYNTYATHPDVRRRAVERARSFVREETQFHLGFLPTEQSHPLTVDFAETVQADPAAGVEQLLRVDLELPPVARRAVLGEDFDTLVSALRRVAAAPVPAADTHPAPRVCFSGCGSTGRLAIMLEEMWRYAASDAPGAIADRACSIMTGGDRALIRAVENFEDYRAFGARQVADLDLGERDVLIAVTEGGETSSVIGTAEEALRRGAQVFFVFNNPRRLLVDHIERSRAIIDNDRVTAIDLFTGPMALSGSTRMQATTVEMLVLGIAVDEALTAEGNDESTTTVHTRRLAAADALADLVRALMREPNRSALAALAADEAALYRGGGRITYFAPAFLLDIFSDTTERSPTFMLPPFRASDDTTAPVSWAFAKDPRLPTDEAWNAMLRRKPRGLSWTAADYARLNAPAELQSAPPRLDLTEIRRYAIGNEPDPSRVETVDSRALWVDVDGSTAGHEPVQHGFGTHRLLQVVTQESRAAAAEAGSLPAYTVRIDVPASPTRLFHHLAMKLIFNTASTASMGILGRIRGNWMIQVDPTNKKLVDRGSRLISHLAGISYEEACTELHVSLEARRMAAAAGESTTTSPVVAALERLDAGSTAASP